MFFHSRWSAAARSSQARTGLDGFKATAFCLSGYDSDECREALAARKIPASIPPKRNRVPQYSVDKKLYKTRHKIENMLGRLNDWRRISTRHDRCSHTFLSAICIVSALIFYLNQWVLILTNR